MRNVLIEKSQTKCDREAITRYFSKKSSLSLSRGKQSKALCSWNLLYIKLKGTKIY